MAVLTEGLAREMSLPFPQLNGPYCIEHIITFYRLPSLLLLLPPTTPFHLTHMHTHTHTHTHTPQEH